MSEERETLKHLLETAQGELETLIYKRDWYIEDTHHPLVCVALWRTLRRNRRIIRLNERIDLKRNRFEYLEQELHRLPAPIPYRLSPAAVELVNCSMKDI